MPRPIIAYEEGNGDHGNPGSRAEDRAKAKVEEQWFTIKDSLPKHFKEKDKYSKWAH